VSTDDLLRSRDDAVLTLAFNRPARRNALTVEVLEAIADAVEGATTDGTRCVVLTGRGGAFSSGVDLQAAVDRPDVSFPELLTRTGAALRTSPLPVIAAIEGPAFGAGLALALASDVRIVATDARLCEAYVKIGRFAGGGDTYWLPQLVGTGRALKMLWSGEVIDGSRAVQIGLAEEAVPPGEALATAQALAATIATAPPEVLRRTKQAVYALPSMPLDDALQRSVRLSGGEDDDARGD
jgi:enoyl-CoA hydratase/carnithine racemase